MKENGENEADESGLNSVKITAQTMKGKDETDRTKAQVQVDLDTPNNRTSKKGSAVQSAHLMHEKPNKLMQIAK